jgi:hypothetical protein
MEEHFGHIFMGYILVLWVSCAWAYLHASCGARPGVFAILSDDKVWGLRKVGPVEACPDAFGLGQRSSINAVRYLSTPIGFS